MTSRAGSRSSTPLTSHIDATGGSFVASLTVTDKDGTSTRLVFTGQTASRNGSAVAHAAQLITVPA